MDGFLNGANGLDDAAFDKLFNDEMNSASGKQHSGVTDFDFVNQMWKDAIENGRRKRKKRSIVLSRHQSNSTE